MTVPEPAARGQSPRVRTVARVLLGICVVVVVIIVFWPGPPAAGAQSGLRDWLVRAHGRGLPGWIDFALIEWLSNVVMFLPVGVLGALAVTRSRSWWVVPASFAVSVTIEVVQWLGFPHRTAAVSDVVANTIGAVIGLVIVCVVTASGNRLPGRSTAAGSPPPERLA